MDTTIEVARKGRGTAVAMNKASLAAGSGMFEFLAIKDADHSLITRGGSMRKTINTDFE